MNEPLSPPRADTNQHAGADLLYLASGQGLFAVEVRFVAGVFQTGHVTKVPHGPDCILGLVSLKGRIVPLLSLDHLMGTPTRPLPRRPAVLLEWADIQFAIQADNVLGVRSLEPGGFQPSIRADGEPVAGIIPVAEGEARLLDVEALVRLVQRMSELKAQQLGLGGLQ